MFRPPSPIVNRKSLRYIAIPARTCMCNTGTSSRSPWCRPCVPGFIVLKEFLDSSPMRYRPMPACFQFAVPGSRLVRTGATPMQVRSKFTLL